MGFLISHSKPRWRRFEKIKRNIDPKHSLWVDEALPSTEISNLGQRQIRERW